VSGQLAFIAIPESAAEVLAASLPLIRHALEDATCWRGDMGDDESATAYQDLIDALDAAEDGLVIASPRGNHDARD
jgi:hypothetical protein